VVTLEAMKMNTYVFAPRSGKVTAIMAVAGTAVEEGSPLLVIA
jgi:biotin carboxyl carrier protein